MVTRRIGWIGAGRMGTLVRPYLTMSRNHGLQDRGVMARAASLGRLDPRPEGRS